MTKRIVVDPITRIEGHLRIEVVVDENNVIQDAFSTATLWRGDWRQSLRAETQETRAFSRKESVASAPTPTTKQELVPWKMHWESNLLLMRSLSVRS